MATPERLAYFTSRGMVAPFELSLRRRELDRILQLELDQLNLERRARAIEQLRQHETVESRFRHFSVSGQASPPASQWQPQQQQQQQQSDQRR